MKNISAWAIRHPTLPLVLFMVLMFLGTVSFVKLPINLNPDVSFPMISVIVSQPGAAPPEVETQITQKIEGAVAAVLGVHNLTSRATEGTSLTNVEFQIGVPLDRAVSDVRDAIAKVRGQLPEGIDEPRIQRQDIDGGAIAYYAIGATSMTQEQLSWFVDNNIAKRLVALPGVAQAGRNGGVEREIRVDLDPGRMQALGITAVEVSQQIRQINLDAPGGRAQLGGGEQSIRVLGGATSVDQLGDTQLRTAGGKVLRLRDIAQVTDGVAEIRSLSRLNGRLATTMGVFKAKGSSDVTVLAVIEKELAAIRKERPDVSIKMVFTTVEITKRSYHSALEAMLLGALLAVLVVWLFLRDVRATLVSALAIPLSAIPTFAFMQAMGFTLNNISMLALSLVAGVLVDDAIVEIENIVRHMRMGKNGFKAALDAADEIGLAVVATSFTIIAVFLPVSFMGGFSGQYFQAFGLTVAAAVFFSLLVARLITPVVAAYVLKPHDNIRTADGRIMDRYLKMLRWSIDHRWHAIAGAALFLVLTIFLAIVIPKSFSPSPDFSSAQLKIELPPGVRIEQTAAAADMASEIVRKHKEVTDVVESVGGDGADSDIRSATLFITLVQPGKRSLSQHDWERSVEPELAQIPDARVSFNNGGFGNGHDITLYIVGDNPVLAERTAERVVDEMKGLKELREPRINGDFKRPEILVRPRLDLAAELGVSVSAISQSIRIATLGDLPQNAAKFSLADRQIPIRVSLEENSRTDLATLENLPVPTLKGNSVPLKAVSDISFGQGPSNIRRYNQSRRFMIEADLNGAELGTAMNKVNALPSLKKLPAGVRLVPVGEAEFMKEVFENFLIAIVAGLLTVFAVLVLLFARLFQPITILSALPLSIGGALIALLLAGKPFSLAVVIGILMLMGIVGKNSILLVDFAIEEMRAGKDRTTALMESGHKRARPIVMTTVAMVAGMMPIALGLGGNKDFNGVMAVAVIGGLIVSTGLTLVVVPAVFTVVNDIERWVAPAVARLLNTSDERSSASAAGP